MNKLEQHLEQLHALAAQLEIPNWTALHSKVTRDAIIAALFYRRYQEALLPAQRDKLGLHVVTAHYIQQFVHEEAENKRQGAVRLIAGPTVIEPRGTSHGGEIHHMITLESGKQGRTPLSFVDSDGAATAAPGDLAASSSDSSQVTAELQTRSDGGIDLVSADALGGNTTDPTNPPTVTVTGSGLTPFVETVAVVAGPASGIQAGTTTIEDRGTAPA